MKKIIIIGAGISGLSAGISALYKGYEVELYEKNKETGGCCNGWVRDDYYIDNCMHWLTGTNQKTRLFDLWKKVGALDEKSNLFQGEYFYKSYFNNEEIALYSDIEKTRKAMLKISLDDEKEINRFIKSVKEMIKTNKTKNIIKEFFYTSKSYLKYKNTSLKELSLKFKHPLLQKLIIDYIPHCYSALSLIYSYATFASGNGKVYLEGSQEFSKKIEKRFLELGGNLYLDSEVIKINIEQDIASSITLKNKEKKKADYFISTIDPVFVFNNLLPEAYFPEELKNRFNDKFSYPIVSSYQIAFLVDKNKHCLKDTVVIEIPDLQVGKTTINRLIIKEYSYLYPQKEKIVYQTITIQYEKDYRYWEYLKKDENDEYEKKKKEIANKILNLIIEKYPSLKDSITILDIWTPLTYTKYFHSYSGSYMGFAFTKDTSMRKLSSSIPNLKNVLLTTVWQNITGGLPVALRNGFNAPTLLTFKKK